MTARAHRHDDEEAAIAAVALLSLAKRARAPAARRFEGYESEVERRVRAYLAASRRRVEAALPSAARPVGVEDTARIDAVAVDEQAAVALGRTLQRPFRMTAFLAAREGVAVVEAARAAQAKVAKAFDPDQPRDDDGRWTATGRAVEKTPEFKEWFRGSKVVDDQGRPLVVFHGTDAPDFDAFQAPAYFAESPAEASAYSFPRDLTMREALRARYIEVPGDDLAGERVPYVGIISDIPREERGTVWATDEGVVRVRRDGKIEVFSGLDFDVGTYDDDGARATVSLRPGKSGAYDRLRAETEETIRNHFAGGEGGRVYPVYLSIRNPKVLSAQEGNRFSARLGDKERAKKEIDRLRAEGYDGVITTSDEAAFLPGVRESLGGKVKQFIVFDPRQVKSATGASHFDADDPRVHRVAKAAASTYVDALDQVNDEAAKWSMRHSARLVTAINATTRKQIRDAVTAAIDSGASVKDLSGVLSSNLAFSDYRATMIARTELAFANIQGNLIGYRATGVTKKEWMVSQDEVCEDCDALDGVVIGIDEQFTYPGTGEEIDGPPSHPHCRCDLLPVLDDTPIAAPPPPPPPPKKKPEPKAPPVPPALPKGYAQPTPAGEAFRAAHEALRTASEARYGARFTSVETRIGRAGAVRAPFAGHHTWTGIIEIVPLLESALTAAAAKRGTEAALTGEEEEAMAILVHEQIHGLGVRSPLRATKAKDTEPDRATIGHDTGWADAIYYTTPAGRVLEEGCTELLSVRSYRELLPLAGFRLAPAPAFYRERLGAGGWSMRHGYSREVAVVERLCQLAAGETNALYAEATPGAYDVLRRLNTKVLPAERAAVLAEGIVAHGMEGLPAAVASLQRAAVRAWIERRLPFYVDEWTSFGASDLPGMMNTEIGTLIGALTEADVREAATKLGMFI